MTFSDLKGHFIYFESFNAISRAGSSYLDMSR